MLPGISSLLRVRTVKPPTCTDSAGVHAHDFTSTVKALGSVRPLADLRPPYARKTQHEAPAKCSLLTPITLGPEGGKHVARLSVVGIGHLRNTAPALESPHTSVERPRLAGTLLSLGTSRTS